MAKFKIMIILLLIHNFKHLQLIANDIQIIHIEYNMGNKECNENGNITGIVSVEKKTRQHS